MELFICGFEIDVEIVFCCYILDGNVGMKDCLEKYMLYGRVLWLVCIICFLGFFN